MACWRLANACTARYRSSMAPRSASSSTTAISSPSKRNAEAFSGSRRWSVWANWRSAPLPNEWSLSELMREKSSSPNSRMPPEGRSRASRRSSTCRHLPWANKPVVASTSPLRSRLVTAPENSMGEPSPSRMSSPRHTIQMYSPLRLRTWYSRSCSSVLPQSMSSMDSSKLWRSRSAMSSRHRGMSPSNTRPGRSKSCCMFSDTRAMSVFMSMM